MSLRRRLLVTGILACLFMLLGLFNHGLYTSNITQDGNSCTYEYGPVGIPVGCDVDDDNFGWPFPAVAIFSNQFTSSVVNFYVLPLALADFGIAFAAAFALVMLVGRLSRNTLPLPGHLVRRVQLTLLLAVALTLTSLLYHVPIHVSEPCVDRCEHIWDPHNLNAVGRGWPVVAATFAEGSYRNVDYMGLAADFALALVISFGIATVTIRRKNN